MRKAIIAIFVGILAMSVPAFAAYYLQGSEITLTRKTYCMITPHSSFWTRADNDASDGSLTLLTGIWNLTAPSGVVIQSGSEPFKDRQLAFKKTVTFIGEEVGKYRLELQIFYKVLTFNKSTQTWNLLSSGKCASIIRFASAIVVPAP